jgi:hypothetical protein
VTINIIDVAEPDWRNLAITDFGTGRTVIGTEMPHDFFVELTNYTADPVDNVSLSFFIDSENIDTKIVSLGPAGGRRGRIRESFSHTFSRMGPHTASVTLKTDRLSVDNSRQIAFEVTEGVRVLLAGVQEGDEFPEGETDALYIALNPPDDYAGARRTSFFEPADVVPHTLVDEKLDEYSVICLANLPEPPEDVLDDLQTFVQAGGGLIIFMGDLVDAEEYNDKMWAHGKGLLPAKLLEVTGDKDRETSRFMTVEFPEHPVFAHASKRFLKQFKEARFYQYMTVDAKSIANTSDVSVLARFTDPDRSPAVIEKRFGRGRVLLVTTSADFDWNQWGGHQSFLPTMQKIFTHLACSKGARRNLVVGETYENRQSEAHKAIVRPPKGPSKTRDLQFVNDAFLLEHENTERAGIYKITFIKQKKTAAGAPGPVAEEQAEDFFAVNLSTGESDLSRAVDKDLKKYLPDFPFKSIPFKDLGRELAEDTGGSEVEGFWWKFLLFIVLLLLVAETILAQVFGKYEKSE